MQTPGYHAYMCYISTEPPPPWPTQTAQTIWPECDLHTVVSKNGDVIMNIHVVRTLPVRTSVRHTCYQGRIPVVWWSDLIGQDACGQLCWKKVLADQNVKMATIFQDGRHFDTQYIRFWIKSQIIILFEWFCTQIIYFWLQGIWIFILRNRKFKRAAIFQDDCLSQHSRWLPFPALFGVILSQLSRQLQNRTV